MATGMAAGLAATGMAAAPAVASTASTANSAKKGGTIYACYSDKTNIMYHAKSSKCKKGSLPLEAGLPRDRGGFSEGR
jgi:predicted lipoprotein with Yx(FWY)xxD motif